MSSRRLYHSYQSVQTRYPLDSSSPAFCASWLPRVKAGSFLELFIAYEAIAAQQLSGGLLSRILERDEGISAVMKRKPCR